MVYKTLKKVSDYCQLLDKSKYPATTTQSGVTFTNNGDGTITLNGTATGKASVFICSASAVKGHKYCILGCPPKSTERAYYYLDTSFGNDYGKGNIVLLNRDIKSGNYYITITAGYTANNLVFKPQLFDLTEMYGAGNEPTTVAEFREKFPNELYDYKPYCFANSYKTLEKVSDVCQLLNKSNYPSVITSLGVTTTHNGDGSITINGTATASDYINCTPPYPQRNNGHVFYVCANNNTMSSSTWYYALLNQSNNLNDYGSGVIGRTNASGLRNTGIVFNKGVVFDNVIIKPQIIDLTEMYGVGNEPKTVAEFREKFPNELYEYKPYSIITSYKKSLICTTKNLFDKTAVYTQGYDFNYCKLIETTDNGWVVKGNVGKIPGSQYQSSGWFAPLSRAESYNPEKCISLKAGDIVTISAYYTVLENNATTKAGIYIGGTELKSVVSITLPEVGVRTRVSQKYTISKDGIYRPVFTLNSSKILIENIQVEYGAIPTEYHSYGYL